ncbi:hypothetical protein NLG97_g9277 [Lecanicillium saksenae]|uniref:Uncharacterized protein n=1 Tax=Lecanicillium saksenae TaxID=468837 RepID=A0ACC1QIF7_9HYPO|nr:hypothetical protein NLG97_g9277 [Lecanicillium saksenae]
MSIKDMEVAPPSYEEATQSNSTHQEAADADDGDDGREDAERHHCEDEGVEAGGGLAEELLGDLLTKEGEDGSQVGGKVVGEVVPPLCPSEGGEDNDENRDIRLHFELLY